MLGRLLNKLLPEVLINKIKSIIRKNEKLYSFVVKNKKKIELLGLTFISLIVIVIIALIVSISTIRNTKNSNDTYYTKDNDAIEVLLTLPNENSAPHPVVLPLKITFTKAFNEQVDLLLLKDSIKFTPLTLFDVAISIDDSSTLEIFPKSKLQEGTQYEVTILAGDYGGDFILKEPYKYYFLTQGGSLSASVGEYTFSTSISKYDPDKKISYFSYINGINNEQQNKSYSFSFKIYKSSHESYLESLKKYYKLITEKSLNERTQEYQDYLVKTLVLMEPDKYGDLILEVKENEITESYTDFYSYGFFKEIELNEEGVYFVTIQKNNQPEKNFYLLVNTIGLIHRANSSSTVNQFFVQSLADGLSPKITIRSFGYKDNMLYDQVLGTTDDDGLLSIKAEDKVIEPTVYSIFQNEIVVVQTSINWPYSLNRLKYGVYAPEHFGKVFTVIKEKNIYQPNEAITFKIIGRVKDQNTFKYFTGKSQEVKLIYTDYNGQGSNVVTLASQKVDFNDKGFAIVKFTNLPLDKGIGYLNITLNDVYYVDSVQRQNYEKPEYEIKMSLDKEVYNYNDEVKIDIQLDTYNGMPVANKEIRLNISAGNTDMSFIDSETCENYLVSSYYDNPTITFFKQIFVKTDETGKAVTKVKIEHPKLNTISSVSVSASVSDVTSTQSNINIKRKYYPSDVFLVTSKDYWYSNVDEEYLSEVTLYNAKCQPIKSKEIEYKVHKKVYNERGILLNETKDIETGTLRTNQSGSAILKTKFSNDGEYVITYNETQNSKITVVNYVTVVAKNKVMFGSENSKVRIFVDKKEYNVGDEVKIKVVHPGITGRAWLILSNDEDVENKIINLKNDLTEITVNVSDKHYPKTYISLNMFANNYSISETRSVIQVNKNYRKIDVNLKTNKESYKPGEEVELQIKTRLNNNDIPSNLTISVVDKSLLDLVGGVSNLLDIIYSRFNSYSHFRQSLMGYYISLHPPGFGSGGDERSIFSDAIFWKGDIATNVNGESTVKFKLNDSLTKWKIIVWADDEKNFGQGSLEVVSTLPIVVRNQFPKEVTVGDEFTVSTDVYNSTSTPQTVYSSIEVKNSLELLSNQQVNFVLQPKSSRTLTWTLKAITVDDQSNFSIKSKSDDYLDIVRENVSIRSKEYEFEELVSGTKMLTINFNISDTAKNLKSVIKVSNYLDTLFNQNINEFLLNSAGTTQPSRVDQVLKLLAYVAHQKRLSIQSDFVAIPAVSSSNFPINYLQTMDGITDSNVGLALSYYAINSFLNLRSNFPINESLIGDLLFFATNFVEIDTINKLFAMYLVNSAETDRPYIQKNYNLNINNSNLAKLLYILENKNLNDSERRTIWYEVKSNIISEGNFAYLPSENNLFGYKNIKDQLVNIILLESALNMDDHELADKLYTWLFKGNNNMGTRETSALASIVQIKYHTKRGVYTYPKTVNLLINGQRVTLQNNLNGIDITNFIQKGSNSIIAIDDPSPLPMLLHNKYARSDQVSNKIGDLKVESKLTNLNGQDTQILRAGEFGFLNIKVRTSSTFDDILVKLPIIAGIELIEMSFNNASLPDEVKNSPLYTRDVLFRNPYGFSTTRSVNGEYETHFNIPVRAFAKGKYSTVPVSVHTKHSQGFSGYASFVNFEVR